ncbi:MAG: nucleotide exchange factor GrpE [Proteobacteria bacterium]|nr:nucleotide exchange factor GrpE [Pseudomonadota bacterium]
MNQDPTKEINQEVEETIETELPENNDQENPELCDVEATEQGDEPLSELEELQLKVVELEEQLSNRNDDLLRMAAEMANTQKRLERDIQNTRKFSNDKIIKAMVPVMDSFDKALEVIEDDSCEVTAEAMIEGTHNTHKIFAKILEDHGITVVNPEGEKFNPELHEAISMVESADHKKNTIVNVFQKGYLLNDRIIRAAMVVVAK